MRVNLRSYGAGYELYVDGVLVLSAGEMNVREALEAISDFSEDVDFLAVDLVPGGTAKLFDDRFFTRSRSGLAGRARRMA